MKISGFKLILLFILLCCAHFVNAQNHYTDSLKQLLKSSKEESVRIDLLDKLSEVFVWSYPDTGRLYAEEGLKLSSKLGDRTREGLFLFCLCVSRSYTGDFTNSLDFGFKALRIFQNLLDTPHIIYIRTALGISYRDQGNYKQALMEDFEAYRMHQLLPSDSGNAFLWLGNISSVYEKDNQLDSAIIYGQKTLKLNNKFTAEYITMGNVYSKKGNQPKALEYYQKGVALEPSDQFSRALSELYNGISKCFESMGRKDSSIYFAQKAYLNAERIDYPPGILEASKQLADLYEARGIPDSTIRYLKLTAALNDSLFSRQKTREAESFVFNDLLHKQELEAQRLLDRNKIKMFGLLSIVGIFLLLAFFLWRNNRHKQKSNFLLREKNTQIQSALNDLKSTQAQLIQSEKMASLGELTAGIAHEIQNPLNFVNNFSEVNKELIQEMKQEYGKGNIERANKIGADISGNEEKIIQHGKRADAIVKSMLQHSMSSAGQKESTDINALTAEYMRLAYRGFRAKDNTINISTKTQFDPSLGNINIVPQDIGRVILNLLNNAFYAVTEKKKNGPNGYEPLVTISTKKNNGLAEITIRDNGNGISQKTMDKIFQPFFTTKPAGQGTGLGLSISYDIIKALGGEIKLETKEGEFAEFVIQLPITVSV